MEQSAVFNSSVSIFVVSASKTFAIETVPDNLLDVGAIPMPEWYSSAFTFDGYAKRTIFIRNLFLDVKSFSVTKVAENPYWVKIWSFIEKNVNSPRPHQKQNKTCTSS